MPRSKINPLEPRLDPDNPKQMDVGGLMIPVTNMFTACIYGFGHHPQPKAREYYFWRCADILWNRDDIPEKLMEKHPWAELMIKKLVRNRYVAIGGAASSGKSHLLAGWGILTWLSQPKDTLVLMTSTALGAARHRIWGSVIALLTVSDTLPVNIRDSIGEASYIDETGRTISRAGLTLIAAEKSRSREAIGKMVGRKQKRILLIADELGEIGESVLLGGLSNLSKNPFFQLVGMSNPASRFDTFGIWSEPKKGWDSVNVETDDEWKTKWGGTYIRLDGERSPNVEAGETVYPYLPTAEKLAEDKELLGEKSRAYYRMVRAVFFDSDETEGIYGETELIRSGAFKTVEFKKGQSCLIAGVDPAFTNGGDRTIMYIARVGLDTSGQLSLQFEECVHLSDDIHNKAVPRTYQIVQQIIDCCKKHKIQPQDLAVDSTGAGSPFCDVLAGEWSPDILRVNFGGKASDKKVSMNSRLSGTDLYTNRVSELWFVGKEFARCRQLRGISADLGKEMCSRRYDMIKGTSSLRVKIEPKSELKSRMGMSPDLADAAFIALDLARQRHGFVAVDPPGEGEQKLPKPQISMKSLDMVSRSDHASLDT